MPPPSPPEYRRHAGSAGRQRWCCLAAASAGNAGVISGVVLTSVESGRRAGHGRAAVDVVPKDATPLARPAGGRAPPVLRIGASAVVERLQGSLFTGGKAATVMPPQRRRHASAPISPHAPVDLSALNRAGPGRRRDTPRGGSSRRRRRQRWRLPLSLMLLAPHFLRLIIIQHALGSPPPSTTPPSRSSGLKSASDCRHRSLDSRRRATGVGREPPTSARRWHDAVMKRASRADERPDEHPCDELPERLRRVSVCLLRPCWRVWPGRPRFPELPPQPADAATPTGRQPTPQCRPSAAMPIR